jgi:cyclic pyranopterin phosphate synthase
MSTVNFTHLDYQGKAHMVDINRKEQTFRTATAKSRVSAKEAIVLTESDLLEAQVAGMQAAKLTPRLIPLCHPIPLGAVDVEIDVDENAITVTAHAQAFWRTGVEMEAITAVSVAALSLVASLKVKDIDARIDDIAVWRKSGGRSGVWGRGTST